MFKLIGFLVGSALSALALAFVIGADWTRWLPESERGTVVLPARLPAQSLPLPPPATSQVSLPPSGAPEPANAGPPATSGPEHQEPGQAEVGESAAAVAPPALPPAPAAVLEAQAPVTLESQPEAIGNYLDTEPVPGELALHWQPVWQPFLSELSAKGFAQRLARLTGLDYQVNESGRGRYEVAVAYFTEDERAAHRIRDRLESRRSGDAMTLRVAGIVARMALLSMVSTSGALAASTDLGLAWARFLNEEAGQQPALRFPHEVCFRRAAAAHGLPLTLLLAVARGESDFDPNARSHANAHGLMQILWPTTARHLGLYRLSQLYDPCTNVEAGARYLDELLEHYDGDLHLALAAYNYGPRRIRSDGAGLPAGAQWYSGYIYRHLRYVLGERGPSRDGTPRVYEQEGKLELATFAAPYRAAAFADALLVAAPSLRLDWFRADAGKFRVMLLYEGADDLDRSRALLAHAGFPVP